MHDMEKLDFSMRENLRVFVESSGFSLGRYLNPILSNGLRRNKWENFQLEK